MTRAGNFLMLLLTALAIFGVVHLLFGDSMTAGYGGSGYGGKGGAGSADLLGAEDAGLATKGTAPRSAEEIAAEEAAREAAARLVTKEEGVFGTVTDASGRAIAGAVVQMMPDPPERRQRNGMPDLDPIATASTDQDGAFVVGPSPEDDHAKLRAQAAGYAASVARVRRRGVRVDFILDRGGSLDLRVIDMQGKAIEGARVLHEAGTVVSSGTTDAEGRARFASLPTGTGTLVVTRAGYGAVRDHNVAVAPGETEERTLVLPEGLEIEGTVLNGRDERPVAGAKIRVRYPNLPTLDEAAATQGAVSDEEGRFKITGFVGGNEQVLLRISKEGFAEARNSRNAQTKGDLTVKLFELGEAFEGRVTDADGQPAGGVRITYAWMQQEDPDEVPAATSAEDGSFTLALPTWAQPGRSLTVLAVSDDLGLATKRASVPKEPRERAKSLELKLGGTGGVRGTVKDASGQPVQGAVVSVSVDWQSSRKNAPGGRMDWNLLNLINGGQHHNLTAVTGMDGTYAISAVPALSYNVSATYGLDEFTLPEAVDVRAGETAEADISLGEGGTIEGWILDSEEKPVVGAYVYATPTRQQGWSWWRRQPNARSQSDGRFVLRGITDQTYNVWAYANGYGSKQHQNARMGDKEIQIRLKAKGWIVGVVSREGRPFAGMFTILARPMRTDNRGNGMNRRGGWTPGQQQRVFNTSDGRFELKGLDAGEFSVLASTHDGLVTLQDDVVTVMDGRASREALLELVEGAVVTGTVRDDETGQPVKNIWINAYGKAQDGRAAPGAYGRSDAHGRYEIKGLGRAAYTITAHVHGSPVSEQIDLQPGDRRTVDLVKQPPGSIQFTVVDKEGKPVAGAQPNIQSATGNYVGVNTTALRKEGLLGENYDWRRLWQTGEEGTLTRYHVPPGLVTVWVHKNGYRMKGERKQVQVVSGRVSEVKLELEKATSAGAPGR